MLRKAQKLLQNELNRNRLMATLKAAGCSAAVLLMAAAATTVTALSLPPMKAGLPSLEFDFLSAGEAISGTPNTDNITDPKNPPLAERLSRAGSNNDGPYERPNLFAQEEDAHDQLPDAASEATGAEGTATQPPVSKDQLTIQFLRAERRSNRVLVWGQIRGQTLGGVLEKQAGSGSTYIIRWLVSEQQDKSRIQLSTPLQSVFELPEKRLPAEGTPLPITTLNNNKGGQ